MGISHPSIFRQKRERKRIRYNANNGNSRYAKARETGEKEEIQLFLFPMIGFIVYGFLFTTSNHFLTHRGFFRFVDTVDMTTYFHNSVLLNCLKPGRKLDIEVFNFFVNVRRGTYSKFVLLMYFLHFLEETSRNTANAATFVPFHNC